MNSANDKICHYIELNYPEHWQHFIIRGRQIGNEKKWTKELALASIKDGVLSEKHDAKFANYLNVRKKLQSNLISFSILAFVVAQLISAIV
ncbi:hypothetical protein D5018_20595 [Parashewanella curva]|uniref:Uncharacterized protein n=1 Tax=Parashewanella curva TaxID=2338552 RepID=A0A3L8PTS6_9GAMM|nr:hypothetical protein [Parashewanella curva]RLV57808.1 hypothetical protein D5018_20595 [Parashewanella curva]